VSFTEKEYDYAVSEKKTVLAFVHGDPNSIAVAKADIDPILSTKLKEFRKKVTTGRLVQFWTSRENLQSKIIIALSKAFGETPATGWVRGNLPASEELLNQLNQLRNSLDAVRAENEELKLQSKPRVDDIASLSDMYTLRYKYNEWNSRLSKWVDHSDGRVALTWGEIFGAIGPMFMRPAAPGLISSTMMVYIRENKAHNQTSMMLFDSDEATIKLHLMALGLVESHAAEQKGGGVIEFISLTPQGRRRLVELLAVRTTPANSPA
jgi:hypothetical protein